MPAFPGISHQVSHNSRGDFTGLQDPLDVDLTEPERLGNFEFAEDEVRPCVRSELELGSG